jgi:hypothetical protein
VNDDEIEEAFRDAYNTGSNDASFGGCNSDCRDELDQVLTYVRRLRACIDVADALVRESAVYDQARFALDPWVCDDDICRKTFEGDNKTFTPFVWSKHETATERPCDICKEKLLRGLRFRKSVSA